MSSYLLPSSEFTFFLCFLAFSFPFYLTSFFPCFLKSSIMYFPSVVGLLHTNLYFSPSLSNHFYILFFLPSSLPSSCYFFLFSYYIKVFAGKNDNLAMPLPCGIGSTFTYYKLIFLSVPLKSLLSFVFLSFLLSIPLFFLAS